MAHQHKLELSSHGLLNSKGAKTFTQRLLDDYDVRNSGQNQKAGELSGGNIQKLIVAREMEQHSPLLIAAEPTRGVDIGAIEFIHNKLLEKREKGDAVLLISSELTEIMSLSDRIYVIYEGRAAGEFRKADATAEALGILMMGGSLHEMQMRTRARPVRPLLLRGWEALCQPLVAIIFGLVVGAVVHSGLRTKSDGGLRGAV